MFPTIAGLFERIDLVWTSNLTLDDPVLGRGWSLQDRARSRPRM
jgi:hypothetical protein